MPPPSTHDELALIRAAAGGDRRAFDALMGPRRERVVRTAYQITGNLDDALDVAQGVLVKLWQGLERFDPRRRFDTWVYRITVNAAIDWIRSRGPKGLLQPLSDDFVEVGPSEDGLDRQALQRAFLRLAGRLAPKQRAVFVLREIEGLDTAEIARILEVAESTVRNHLHQVRRTLRSGLVREHAGLLRAFGVDAEDDAEDEER